MLRQLVAPWLVVLPMTAAAATNPPTTPPPRLAVEDAATAETPAPSVEALVTEARERSPALAAARAQVAARRAMERPAGALPDPMVEAMLQNVGLGSTVGSEEMSMLGAEVRQGLPYPDKRAAARAVAIAETAGAEASLAALERRVAAEVQTLYARLWAMDREREILAAAHELVDLLSETARSRYAAGEAEQEAVLKARLQALRLDEERADLASARRGMVAELWRWLDRPSEAALGAVSELPSLPASGGADAADAARDAASAASAPEIARARAAVAVAEARVEAARLELRPGLSVAAGAAYRGGMDPVVTARLGVELPLWRRQKQVPMLRAAEEELAMARHELADTEAMARAEAARAAADLRNAEEQVRRYREGILPQADAALDAARASYLAGRGDFATVAEDFDLWLQARVGLARREADRYAAAVALQRLTAPAGANRDPSRSNP